MKNVAIALGSLVALAGVANAQVWNEVGEAGDLPGSDQVVAGSGPLQIINGSLLADDVDMYRIRIDDPSLFLAQHTAPNFDSQMWLFRPDGMGVSFRDDANGLRGAVSGAFVLSAGEYLLAISGWDRDAVDSNNAPLWLDTPFGTERAPDGAGAANPVAGWSGAVPGRGNYEIALRGASFVPAPGALALVGLGGVMVGRRRRA
ncbi:MAG: DVUA0089 family protein [Phycisphaerales bacterium]